MLEHCARIAIAKFITENSVTNKIILGSRTVAPSRNDFRIRHIVHNAKIIESQAMVTLKASYLFDL